MAKQTESSPLDLTTKRNIDRFEYKKRFEEAVSDAQYLIIYASSNCPTDINIQIVEKLISLRHKVENGEEITAQEEAAFWVNYQDIWNLVKPVTAESVKANLAVESTFTGRLFSTFPTFAWWFGVRPTSKAGKAANWYSFVTVTLLLILIVVQAYWVIGNRLIDQLAGLLQKETEVNSQIIENQNEYSALEVLYKQNELDSENYRASGEFTFYKSPGWERDTLENLSKQKQLETELELLKTQLERNSAILLIWSSPWDGLIQEDSEDAVLIPVTGGFEEQNLTAINEYMLQIESIQAQIDTIDQYLLDDPNGEKEALSLNSKYDPVIARNEEQLGNLYAENSDLYVREAEIQSQIDAINAQLDAITKGTTTIEALTNELNIQLANLRTQKSAIDQKIGEINSQLGTLTDQTEEEINARNALQAQLTGLQTEQKTIEGEIVKIENQLKAVSGNADTLKELNTELESLTARKRFNNDQIQTLQTENSKLLEQRIPGGQIVIQWREEKQRLADELNSLNRQVQAEARREASRQAQLAGTFVLVILQSYILPLLYGVLGASSFILRTLSQQIKDVTYSEENRVQNPVRISLGALAGIMVGFLLPTDEATSFLGSVSPLALAFLVGYNIDFFFSIMDFSLNKLKAILEKPAKEEKEARAQMSSHSTAAEEIPEEEPKEEASEPPAEQPSEPVSDKQ